MQCLRSLSKGEEYIETNKPQETTKCCSRRILSIYSPEDIPIGIEINVESEFRKLCLC
jgi:hypothetical protein